MRGWIILLLTLLVGAGLSAAGTVYGPPMVDPYLPKDLRIRSRIVEGQVTKKQREPNRVLVKIETPQGVILAAFTKRMAEIDLLVEPGDTIALALPATSRSWTIRPSSASSGRSDAHAGRGDATLRGSRTRVSRSPSATVAATAATTKTDAKPKD